MTGSGRPGNGIPAEVRTEIAHPARVYDYWLGGKDNFAADRAAAEQVQQVMPEILDTVRGNRRFLVRTVGFLRDAGIRQFLDIGSGPAGIVARYLTALAPGSYLVISHATNEFSPEKMRANADVADNSGTMLIPRSRDAILHMFNARELVDPGLVLVSRWRPEGGDPGPNADRAWAYGGVAALTGDGT
jgi:hypothetical protein